jgi:hypothetical protein
MLLTLLNVLQILRFVVLCSVNDRKSDLKQMHAYLLADTNMGGSYTEEKCRYLTQVFQKLQGHY